MVSEDEGCLLTKVIYWWKLSIDESSLLMEVVYWWKLSIDENSLLMEVVFWWKVSIDWWKLFVHENRLLPREKTLQTMEVLKLPTKLTVGPQFPHFSQRVGWTRMVLSPHCRLLTSLTNSFFGSENQHFHCSIAFPLLGFLCTSLVHNHATKISWNFTHGRPCSKWI